ncbi:PAS domain-containing sensor histidine kinase [Croceivirga thetidis]|uniref:histidine kinase n=1 Tax=Croceivirga thetidis TaxID=2721623 RepID=A0ABX1GMZ1_9FLAO|nr:PAS domain-containing sensor histidine kinase [Croceivirga thetidis]NKI31239.1 PAS domain-containing sensor histidine kinase [Croceivirga thetidis]
MENLAIPSPKTTNWVHDVPSFTAIVDKDLNLVDASMGWFKHSNLDRENAIGKRIYDLVEHIDETWEDSFEYALEGVNDIKLVDKKAGNSNSASSFVWHLNPWKDGYGHTVGLVITIKEQQKQASQFIDEASLKAIFENNKDSIIASWEYRIDENQMFWSNEFRNLLALPEQIAPSLRKSLTFIENNKDQLLLNAAIKRALTSGTPWDIDLTLKDLNENKLRLNLIGRPKFKNGKCTRILGVLQKKNLTEKKETPKPEKPFEIEFFNSVPTNLVLLNLKTGKIVQANNHLLAFLGKTQGFFKGKNYSHFISLDKHLDTVINESLRTRFGFNNIELQVFNKNIGRYTFLVSGNLITVEGQKLLLVSCQDATRSTEVEQHFSSSLKEANNEIEKMVHFAHLVSHDLKAHTTNFGLLLNFLNTEEDELERKNLIQMLFQSTDNLTDTIKGLRELVAIKHQENTKKKKLNLNDFVYKVLQINNGVIKKKNAKIHNEIDDSVMVNAIPAYLESTLSNLVLNGLRFLNNNERPVLILSAEANKKYTVFSIEDNSMGIDLDEEADKVFGLYKKLKNMGDSTSMGLYLTKYQIELMGGRIEVESAKGEGNVFKVYFPV